MGPFMLAEPYSAGRIKFQFPILTELCTKLSRVERELHSTYRCHQMAVHATQLHKTLWRISFLVWPCFCHPSGQANGNNLCKIMLVLFQVIEFEKRMKK